MSQYKSCICHRFGAHTAFLFKTAPAEPEPPEAAMPATAATAARTAGTIRHIVSMRGNTDSAAPRFPMPLCRQAAWRAAKTRRKRRWKQTQYICPTARLCKRRGRRKGQQKAAHSCEQCNPQRPSRNGAENSRRCNPAKSSRCTRAHGADRRHASGSIACYELCQLLHIASIRLWNIHTGKPAREHPAQQRCN